MFELTDPRGVLTEVDACRDAFPNHYVKVSAFDNSKGRETTAISFIVQRPAHEPGFRIDRHHAPGRTNRYALHSYAAEAPHGERYQ